MTDPKTARRLVIVTGAGRSGTSMVAGALTRLGYTVPPPVMGATEANPRGHYEPLWVINFHKRHLRRASVNTMDSRPDAPSLVDKVCKGRRPQATLTTWLEKAFEQPHLVIKDPRAFWFRDLWVGAARSVGVEPTFLTMLRHPAEVVGSRTTYYGGKNARQRADREISLVAGWFNATTVNEHTSRGHRRTFALYDELLTDWRGTLLRISDTLDLGLDERVLRSTEPHAVDDFIDPGLHRIRADWTNVSAPQQLVDLAEGAWQILAGHASGSTDLDAAALTELDRLRATYGTMYKDAVALSHDEIQRRVRAAERRIRKEIEAGEVSTPGQGRATSAAEETGLGSLGRGVVRATRAEVAAWRRSRRR
ncbi:sulfotransferase family protein [Segeticoccus rhizosphaerae]|jgi:hypothetical protein|uniref:sulfotransferase family protein n=1 Tax=Segeticoccus rhizosphaerae TaxID=1104777 RepID=UPI0010C140AE|nr:hypothetical protein [Ornithinicoccus soli]